MDTPSLGTRTLEMVAVALSEEYGIKVVSSGRRAYTSYSPDGGRPVITIPSIDSDDEHYIHLLRGYVDHEVGHIRFSDQKEITAALDQRPDGVGALKTLIHLFEDIHVEQLMGECFPGCRRNLRKLVSLVFHERRPTPVDAGAVLDKAAGGGAGAQDMPHHIWTALCHYIAYRVRQDAQPELAALLPVYREPVDALVPGLTARLEPVLSRVFVEGKRTRAAIALAEETLDLIRDFLQTGWTPRTEEQARSMLASQMNWVLKNGGSAGESVDIGKAAARMVEDILIRPDSVFSESDVIVHHAYGSFPWQERLAPLTEQEQKEALQAAAMLDAQMQSLLQTFVLNRSGSARTGRLDTNALHRLSVGNNRIFRKTIEKRGLDTQVVLAVDMSGSMKNYHKSIMASKALYAVILSLRKIPGLTSSVTGYYDNCVLDILRPYDRVTPRMNIRPEGGTLCGNALKYAMQIFTGARQARRIVLMLTDGDTDNAADFQASIIRAGKAGIECMGIGIMDEHIRNYLPPDDCCVIEDVRQMAPQMFRMLRNRLYDALW